jgi:hypothetical protein
VRYRICLDARASSTTSRPSGAATALNTTFAASLARGCPLVKRRSVALQFALDARLLRRALLAGVQAALEPLGKAALLVAVGYWDLPTIG